MKPPLRVIRQSFNRLAKHPPQETPASGLRDHGAMDGTQRREYIVILGKQQVSLAVPTAYYMKKAQGVFRAFSFLQSM